MDSRRLSSGAFELELSRPPSFDFTPGQTVRLFRGETMRDYSLASGREEPTLKLCIRIVQGATLSPYLAAAPKGTRLALTGPHGHFVFRPSERPAVFIATGTGIAPFTSMARSGREGYTLLHGVRAPEDLFFEALFRERAAAYIPCVSGPDIPAGRPRDLFRGRVTEYVRSRVPAGSYDFYLCGNENMVRDVTLLVDERFPDSRVYTEIFF